MAWKGTVCVFSLGSSAVGLFREGMPSTSKMYMPTRLVLPSFSKEATPLGLQKGVAW